MWSIKSSLNKILCLLLVVGYGFATEWEGYTFSRGNVWFEILRLMGTHDTFYQEEITDCAHKVRLTRSLTNKLGIKGEISATFHPSDSSAFAPSTLIQYGKKAKELPYPIDDISFSEALLRLWKRKGNVRELLSKLPDKGAPSISADGKRVTYLLWLGGRQAIVAEDREGNILWKWEAEPSNQRIISEPLISPNGRWIAFLVEEKTDEFWREECLPSGFWSPFYSSKKVTYTHWIWEKKIFLRDLTQNSFYKLPIPSPSPQLYPIGSPFLLSFDNFILFGRAGEKWDEGSMGFVELYFLKGKDILYSTVCLAPYFNGRIPSRFQLLWSPNQLQIAVIPEVGEEQISMDRVFLIDPLNKKNREFKILPAHYSFLWDGERGLYLATKGKRKGEIFYLDFGEGKVRRKYQCAESLEALCVGKDGALLLKRGKDKLMVLKGGIVSLKKARFYKYLLNEPPYYTGMPEPEVRPGRGAFRDKVITLVVTERLTAPMHRYWYVDAWHGEGVRKNLLMPKIELGTRPFLMWALKIVL